MKKGEVRLKGLFLCEYASFSEDKKLNINGIFDRIFVKQFPANHQQASLVGIVQGKPNEQVLLVIKLVDEEGKEVMVPKTVTARVAPSGKWNFIFMMQGIPFPRSGRYRFGVYVGKTLLDEVTIELILMGKGEPNGNKLPN